MMSSTMTTTGSVSVSVSETTPLVHQSSLLSTLHNNTNRNNNNNNGYTSTNRLLLVNRGDDDTEQQQQQNQQVLVTSTSIDILNYSRRLIYASHFFEQLSEMTWQFALLLFLAALTNYQSMILVSTYGLLSNSAVCLFASKAGQYVDTQSNRLYVARLFIWIENLCVVGASIICFILLRLHEQQQQDQDQQQDSASSSTSSSDSTDLNILSDHYSILLLIGLHILGPIALILDSGFLVAIERDWVVVLGQVAARLLIEQQEQDKLENDIMKDCKSTISDDNNRSSTTTVRVRVHDDDTNIWLVETNVKMKQIDLSCKIIAPAIAGIFIDCFGSNHLSIAALVVSIINILSLLVEYTCTAQIHYLIPELSWPKQSKNSNTNNNNNKTNANQQKQNCIETIIPCYIDTNHPLIIYFQQHVWYAGFGLSLLYFNALTFGGLMVNYLLFRGMRLSTVGTLRGISSSIGLLGTFVYKFLVQYLSLPSTGMYAIIYQFIFISFSMVAMFITTNYTLSMSLLIIGVCTSRIGLYVFEMSVLQLMQQYIPESIRGSIGGTQNSLNAFFQLSSFAVCLIYTNPNDFIIVVTIGYIAVGTAAILFAIGIYNKDPATFLQQQ